MQPAEARTSDTTFELCYPKLHIPTTREEQLPALIYESDSMASPPQHEISDFSDSDDPYEIVSHASGQSDDDDDEECLVEAHSASPSVFPIRTNSDRVDSPQELTMRKELVKNMHKNPRQEDEVSAKSFESDVDEEEENVMSTPTIVPSVHQSQDHVDDVATAGFEVEDHVIRFVEKEDENDEEIIGGVCTKMSSLRMPMLRHHLQVQDSFRVFYSGDRKHLQQVLWKIGQVLVVSANDVAVKENKDVEEYDILDISPIDFTTNPEVEIAPSFGSKLIVEVDETAEGNVRKVRGAHPDLAIVVQDEPLKDDAYTFFTKDGKGIHVPSIQVAAYNLPAADFALPKVVPIMSTPVTDEDGIPKFALIGLETFLDIDAEQLNRYIAFLVSRKYSPSSYYDLLEKACCSLRNELDAALASAKATTAQLGTACELGFRRVSKAIIRRLSTPETDKKGDASADGTTKPKVSVASELMVFDRVTVLTMLLTTLSVILPLLFFAGMTPFGSGSTLLARTNVTSPSVLAGQTSATPLLATTSADATIVTVPTITVEANTDIFHEAGAQYIPKGFLDAVLKDVMANTFDISNTLTKYVKHDSPGETCASKWSLQLDGAQLVMSRPTKPSWSCDRGNNLLVAVDDRCDRVGLTINKVNATQVLVDVDEARLNKVKGVLLTGKDVDGMYVITSNALRKIPTEPEHFNTVEDAVSIACKFMKADRKVAGLSLSDAAGRFANVLEASIEHVKRQAQSLTSPTKDRTALAGITAEDIVLSAVNKHSKDAFEPEPKTMSSSMKDTYREYLVSMYKHLMDTSELKPQKVADATAQLVVHAVELKQAMSYFDTVKSFVKGKSASRAKEEARSPAAVVPLAMRTLQKMTDAIKQHTVPDIASMKQAMFVHAKGAEESLIWVNKAMARSMEEAHSRTQAAAVHFKDRSSTAAKKAGAQAKAVSSRIQDVIGGFRVGRKAA